MLVVGRRDSFWMGIERPLDSFWLLDNLAPFSVHSSDRRGYVLRSFSVSYLISPIRLSLRSPFGECKEETEFAFTLVVFHPTKSLV